MAQHNELYGRSDLYDIALERDVVSEVEFLTGVYEKLRGRSPSTGLEIACGPGYHARNLAQRGVRAWGLDLRPEMVELAQQRAEAEGLQNTVFFAGDMREFRVDEPVDLAFALFDSIDCLLTNEDLIRHFRYVGANLAEGGLYVVDCTHPRDCSYQHYGDFVYEGTRDGKHVRISWAVNEPMVDPVTGVVDTEIEIRVEQNGEVEVIRDHASERCVTAPELSLIATASGELEAVAWYGDFNIDVPLDASPRSKRMIGVFAKR